MKFSNFVVILILSLSPFTLVAQNIIQGTLTMKDGAVYEGDIVGKKPHGKGMMKFPNGDVYKGEFVKGKRQGKGTFVFADGEKYVGEWYQNQQHGKGT